MSTIIVLCSLQCFLFSLSSLSTAICTATFGLPIAQPVRANRTARDQSGRGRQTNQKESVIQSVLSSSSSSLVTQALLVMQAENRQRTWRKGRHRITAKLCVSGSACSLLLPPPAAAARPATAPAATIGDQSAQEAKKERAHSTGLTLSYTQCHIKQANKLNVQKT